MGYIQRDLTMDEQRSVQRTVLLVGEWEALPGLQGRLRALGYEVVAATADAATAADVRVIALGARGKQTRETLSAGDGDLPFVVIAVEEDEAVLRQVLAAGADGYVVWPSSDGLLRAALEIASQRGKGTLAQDKTGQPPPYRVGAREEGATPSARQGGAEQSWERALKRHEDDFLTVIGHELRTPLTSLRLYHELLAARPERLPEYMKVLQRETGRLIRITETLLDVSRLDQEEAPGREGAISLAAAVTEAVGEIAGEIAASNVLLSVDVPQDLPPVWGDRVSLVWLISILLDNAANYTPGGGQIDVQATLEANEANKRCVLLRVVDTGLGLSAADMERAFDRFYRGTAARATNLPGTGLGLDIARSLAERVGGTVTLESPGMGAGTTATVRLLVAEAP
jgi:signal transduction histidine kinase